MYFVEGLANNRIAVVGKIHHALADGVASANLMARGMDLLPTPEGGPYMTDPAPTTRELMTFGVRRSPAPHRANPRDDPLHRARVWAGCDAARASCHRN